MPEIHPTEGKVLRAIKRRSSASQLQIGEAVIEEMDPLEALQQIAAILELDTFHTSESIKGNDGHEYHVLYFCYGGRETTYEFRRKFKVHM